LCDIRDGLANLERWSFTYEIAVEGVTSWVTIGENKWLGALARGPGVLVQRGVPINLVEQVGNMEPSFWAVYLSTSGTFAAWVLHIVLVVGKTNSWVVAGWKVEVRTKWGGISITVLIWETNTSTSVARVLDTNTVKTVRVGRVRRNVVIGAGTDPLDWLWSSFLEVNNDLAGGWWASSKRVANKNPKTRWEGSDLIIGSVKAITRLAWG